MQNQLSENPDDKSAVARIEELSNHADILKVADKRNTYKQVLYFNLIFQFFK